MTVDSKGRELFIVDNSVSGWTGLRYLEEWSSIAKAFDIATGYFEIGALLTLDGKWQALDKIRILMGAEITLLPVNPDFEPIVLTGADEDELQVVAELVEALEG